MGTAEKWAFFIFVTCAVILYGIMAISIYNTPAPTDTAAEPGCTLPREEGEPLP